VRRRVMAAGSIHIGGLTPALGRRQNICHTHA
jgi:hypothetical protein